MGVWTIQQMTSEQANCFSVATIGEKNDRFFIRCTRCRQTLAASTAEPVSCMDVHWENSPGCRAVTRPPVLPAPPKEPVIVVTAKDVARWLNANKNLVAISVPGRSMVLEADEVIYVVQDQGLILKTKPISARL